MFQMFLMNTFFFEKIYNIIKCIFFWNRAARAGEALGAPPGEFPRRFLNLKHLLLTEKNEKHSLFIKIKKHGLILFINFCFATFVIH